MADGGRYFMAACPTVSDKKAPLFTDSRYEVTAMPHDIMLASHYKDGQQMLGVFSLRGKSSHTTAQRARWILSKSDQRPKS